MQRTRGALLRRVGRAHARRQIRGDPPGAARVDDEPRLFPGAQDGVRGEQRFAETVRGVLVVDHPVARAGERVQPRDGARLRRGQLRPQLRIGQAADKVGAGGAGDVHDPGPAPERSRLEGGVAHPARPEVVRVEGLIQAAAEADAGVVDDPVQPVLLAVVGQNGREGGRDRAVVGDVQLDHLEPVRGMRHGGRQIGDGLLAERRISGSQNDVHIGMVFQQLFADRLPDTLICTRH
mmetsp:Transcript_34311/g.67471  ORF Transcript_34311/g.67471 Transcript_34311/m.67471 type:complete len:236 (-) Transcript_34311:43-750(-)